MLFDTDVVIWAMRGSEKAADAIDQALQPAISIISYMELLRGARDKREIKNIRSFLKDVDFKMLPVTENIGHRASIYMEEYCLKVDMCVADALLAATAAEHQLPMLTGNKKHYTPVADIELKVFRP
jgi:predicted nucleic acid-binding protein